MKLSAALALILVVQEALSTHLETCDCSEIQQLVNTTVQEAVAGLEERISYAIDSAVRTNSTITLEDTVERFLKPIKQQLDYRLAQNITTSLEDAVKRFLRPIKQQLDYHLPQETVEIYIQ
jgi:uncharacterized membrane protein YheB (UPF0754 family)